MFFRILKRDLKRKRIMNIILLLFIILSAMFISSSVKNLVTVSGAVDDSFRMAGVQNYAAGCISDGVSYADMGPVMEVLQNVDSYQTEAMFAFSRKENLSIGGRTVEMPGALLCSSMDRRAYRYYGEDNREITEIKPGEVWFPTVQKGIWKAEPGDEVKISLAGVEKTFRLGGYLKDPMFNSAFVSSKRILMNEEDFAYFYENPAIIPYTAEQANIMTSDLDALNQEFMDLDPAYLVNYNVPQTMLKYTYILDVLVTAILLVFSLFIVLIALTILKFSIRFSIEEDFREIGVMKAIGLPMGKTRWMYVSKYTGLGVLGAALGFLLGIPFGNLLIASSAQNMVITGSGNYFLNLVSAVAVALLIVLFSYHCAGRMKKYTPMDAIRSGETGERYGQKGKIHLSRSKISVPFFLALNDLLSSPRRYGVMLTAFSLSLILLTMLGTTAATLSSEKLVKLIGVQESDVYLTDVLQMEKVLSADGGEYAAKQFSEIQETVQHAGIPCKVFAELWFRVNLQKGDKTIATGGYYGFHTDAEEYSFLEGSAPAGDNEIALTPLNAQRLGVSVGDTVLCNGEECILTGIYDCFNNMGDSMRLSPQMDMDFENCIGLTAVQVKFLDSPDAEKTAEYVKTIQDLFPEFKVLDPEEFLSKIMGKTAAIVTGLKNMAVLIVLLVSVFTVVLMERSFISREKNEIALMKAVGFRNAGLCRWHSLRIALVIILSGLIGLLISGPLTKLCIGPVFAMMGASQIEFVANPAENYIFYPVLMIVFTVAADWLTAQCMGKITAADTSNIE